VSGYLPNITAEAAQGKVDVARNGREARVTATPARVNRFDHDRLSHRFGGGGRLQLVTLATAGACLALSAATHAAAGEAAITGGSTTTAPVARTPAPAEAIGAPDTAALTAEPLVSPQYQAKAADTEARAGPTGPAADPSGGDATDVAAGSDPESRLMQLAGAVVGAVPVPTRRLVAGGQAGLAARLSARQARTAPLSTAWYRTQKSRYQLHQRSQQEIGDPLSVVVPPFLRDNLKPKVDQIGQQIVRRDAQANGPKVISSAVRPTEQVADARLLLRLGLALGLAYLVFLVAWFWTTRDRTHGARVVRF
jgi:hypothetical protein